MMSRVAGQACSTTAKFYITFSQSVERQWFSYCGS